MNIKAKGKNMFADKASLILRAMLKHPEKKWVVRDFVNSLPISLGMAGEVIAAMERMGYVERQKKGALSYTVLANKEKLIRDWVNAYEFNLNSISLYYHPGLKLSHIKSFFKGRDLEEMYAFTLHSGANFETSYVKTGDIYLYIDHTVYDRILLDLRQQLGLKELVQGGNVYLIKPYYKNSVFWGNQKIRGYRVVSNLQLYLDLYHFRPRGAEHAAFLKERLEERGVTID